MPNKNLSGARNAKNDEFYTQYSDIQREINSYIDFNPDVFRDKVIFLPADDPEWSNFTKFFAQNFVKFGLKELISTSYAPDSKPADIPYQLTLFETSSPEYDETKTRSHGKIFTLTRANAKKVDIDDLQYTYLQGDGDFRSDEVKAIRDKSDIIITNPPFSLFREFLAWIIEANKQFLIIGNINCISYKEVFPLIKNNQIWLGTGMGRWISGFIVPEGYELYGTEARIENGQRIVATNNCLWLTNLDHGRRHKPLKLMSMSDNIKFSKHKEVCNHEYQKYDNYDAIEVPFTDAIPDDYSETMGVPITFLDKYCPDQFEIVALGNGRDCFTPNKDYINPKQHSKKGKISNGEIINRVLAINQKELPLNTTYYTSDNSDYLIAPYARVLIRKKG